MKVIVVTGGIGSGKSEVCRILESRGIPVYDCDSRAKALYGRYGHLRSLVIPGIFEKPDALAALENELFPLLMEDFREWASQAEKKAAGGAALPDGGTVVAFESATVLQKRYFDGFGDWTLLVDAPEELRLERAVKRAAAKAGISPETAGGAAETEAIRADVRGRMALQPSERGNPRVDFIIDNSASVKDTEAQTDKFLKSINYHGN